MNYTRCLIASAAAFAATSGWSQSTVSKEEPTKSADVVELQAFSVTGTNIKRLDQEKVLPVTVMSADAIDIKLPKSAVDVLIAMPEVANVPLTESDSAGSAARGDNASVNLRGIGSGNTLVLLNGRRVVPQSESSFAEGGLTLSTNVNTMPSRGLQQVEVLRDGASSVYGTDAVAGVINFIMQSHYVGTQLDVNYGFDSKRSGNARTTITFGADTANGRGNLMSVTDFFHRDISFVRDYYPTADKTALAPAPWNNAAVNTNFFGPSSNGFYGQFQVGAVDPNTGPEAWAFTPGRPANVPAAMAATNGTFFFVPNSAGSVSFKTTTPSRTGVEAAFYGDTNKVESLLPKTDRINTYNKFEYKLNDSINAYAEVSAYQAKSVEFRSNEGVNNGTDGNFIVPVNSPWNPFGSRFFDPAGAPNSDGTSRLVGTPSAVNVFTRRFTDLQRKRAEIKTTVYRLLGGIKGTFGPSWTWDAGAFYSSSRTTDNEWQMIRGSLLQLNLNSTQADVEYNPFGYTFAVQNGAVVASAPYTNSAAVINSFARPFRRDGQTSLASGDFRASGKLFELWGNTVSLAGGGEFRHETFDDVREPFAGLTPANYPLARNFVKANDFNANSPNADTHAQRDIWGVYAEAVAPVVGEQNKIPLVRSLELSGSVRHDNYNDFGGTTKPKFGLNWKPTRGIMFRASYNEAFRAPNMAIYYAGTFYRSGSGDLYRFPVTGLTTDNSSMLIGYNGNNSLKPESAKGYNVGTVVEVPGAKGLSFSVDLWQVKQTDVIQLSNSFQDDNNALLRVMAAAKNSNTPINQINLGSGTASYVGSPLVTRAPVTAADIAAFTTYNARLPYASQLAPVGAIVFMKGTFQNAASAQAEGLDIGLNWLSPKFVLGRFSFASNWAYLVKSFTQVSAATPIQQRAGTDASGPEPRWRGTSTLTWSKGNWTTGWGGYYYGKYAAIAATTNQATWDALGNPTYITKRFDNGAFTYRYVVHDAIFHNVFVRYRLHAQNRWLNDLSIRVAASNVFDKTPPLSPDTRGYNVQLYSNMAQGRSWSVDLSKKF